MHKRIILLDLDGTIITRSYQLTVAGSKLRSVVENLQTGNTFVGLNSDTPLQPLKSWAGLFGMRGPLIGEKGQVLSFSPAEPAQTIGGMGDYFRALKRQVILRSHEQFANTFIGIGDVTEFVRQGGKIFGEDRQAIFINGYRQCSFSAYALAYRDGSLTYDAELYELFCNLVMSLVAPDEDRLAEADKNDLYGILILHEKGASKTRGFQHLIDRLGDEIEYVMIGDSLSDQILTDHPVKVCAVGNASPELKAWALETGGMVADAPFTEGVIEILSSFSSVDQFTLQPLRR